MKITNDKPVLVIIPARLASTRLPNKPLANINGQSMIARVAKKALLANVGKVIVACDSTIIAQEVSQLGVEAIITNPDLPSGTDRIYRALTIFLEQTNAKITDFSAIINLQGDLPLINPELLQILALATINGESDITTLAAEIVEEAEINNPNVVKIAIANIARQNLANQLLDIGNALYFSRSAIPHSLNGKEKVSFYHHIGIYGYKPLSLAKFINLKQSNLEKIESLEQLRALENKMSISVAIVNEVPVSVDDETDLAKAIKLSQNQNI
jgi:3-deoxy-manno-octulosonate cytidylyltransferase (CMP-KDO synthetase)